MSSNKNSRYDKYRNVSVYFPVEMRQQLIFYCKYHNIAPSTLCSKLVKNYLAKKNVGKLMIDYAMEQVDFNWKKD